MPQITIATTNQAKITEIARIINECGFENITAIMLDNSVIQEADEPYDNFIDNAINKAKFYAKITNQITLSEDSGLCIASLNNFPGVRSKEFAQSLGSFSRAFDELQTMLANKTDYTAYFHNAAAIYCPADDILLTSEASIYGKISFPARGRVGFGFDPIFIPDGFTQTFAELDLSIKNRISHRAQAIKDVLQKFMAVLPQIKQ